MPTAVGNSKFKTQEPSATKPILYTPSYASRPVASSSPFFPTIFINFHNFKKIASATVHLEDIPHEFR
jgi:hypothetical protein